jgi:hypothetical protein
LFDLATVTPQELRPQIEVLPILSTGRDQFRGAHRARTPAASLGRHGLLHRETIVSQSELRVFQNFSALPNSGRNEFHSVAASQSQKNAITQELD